MKNAQSVISSLVTVIYTAIIFAIPLFFLTTTQEFYATSKFYLLGFGVLALIAVLAVNFLLVKKVRWVNSPLDTILIAFLIFYATSLFIASPNKVQALLKPTHGLGVMVFLVIFYFITVHFSARRLLEETRSFLVTPLNALFASATAVAAIAIIFFLNPFKNIPLPLSLTYLKNPQFTPLGTQLDLALFLGFFVVFGVAALIGRQGKRSVASFVASIVIVIAAVLVTYTLFEPFPATRTPGYDGPKSLITSLPPFSSAWYGALESLKDWKTAFFGFGVDNFGSVFTRVKPVTYNATPLWRVNFTDSRSFLLQLWAEGGILTFGAFLMFLVFVSRMVWAKSNEEPLAAAVGLLKPHDSQHNLPLKLGLLYLLVVMLFFPASLPVLFIFFLLIATVAAYPAAARTRTSDLTSFAPLVGLLVAIILVAVGVTSYFLGRSYLAEYYFKDSINNIATNNGQQVYENMRQAILLNPYIERYRMSFGQLNLLLANNLASTAGADGKKLTDADRQNISQAIQAAIAEARAVVILNPQKAGNWENLAVIYRNLINVAEGADSWTVSSYQRAMILDPNNPIYRLSLGGVFYSFQNYKDAARFFEQSASLKPDWPNSHYNLAWAYFQLKDYEQAVAQMEAVLSLLDPAVNKEDYKKAQKDLEDFKKLVPAKEEQPTQGTTPSQLNLPTPPAASVEPKLELREDEAGPPTTPSPSPEAETTPTP